MRRGGGMPQRDAAISVPESFATSAALTPRNAARVAA
jgi:hypothetical protein